MQPVGQAAGLPGGWQARGLPHRAWNPRLRRPSQPFLAADPVVLGGTGKLTLTWAPAVTPTCCVWVTSFPFSFQRARTS
jgi:hypothetical protein